MTPAASIIIANLDVELDYQRGTAGGARRRRCLPVPVLESISAIGTLLRVFGDQQTKLWTPLAVDPARITEEAGLPRPELVSGPVAQIATRPTALLCWAESCTTQALRQQIGVSPEDRSDASATLSTPPALPDRLWTLPPATAATAARSNHRALCLELRQQLDCELPGSRMVSSLEQLESHLSAGGADAGGGQWVIKAPWSAAGRDRLRGHRSELCTTNDRAAAARLFRLHGELLFEPWMNRLRDLACCAIVDHDAVDVLGVHEIAVTSAGGFRSALVPPDALSNDGADRLVEVARHVGWVLHTMHYRGPFGIDAWWYRDSRGHAVLQPLGEINARLTLGFLTRGLAEHLWARGAEGRAVQLCLGSQDELDQARAHSKTAAFPLLDGVRGTRAVAAWITLLPATRWSLTAVPS